MGGIVPAITILSFLHVFGCAEEDPADELKRLREENASLKKQVEEKVSITLMYIDVNFNEKVRTNYGFA